MLGSSYIAWRIENDHILILKYYGNRNDYIGNVVEDKQTKQTNSVVLARERTIPNERPIFNEVAPKITTADLVEDTNPSFRTIAYSGRNIFLRMFQHVLWITLWFKVPQDRSVVTSGF
jgi:hypothetical protein